MIFFQIFIGNELHIGRRVDSVKLRKQVDDGAWRPYDIDCQAAFSISYVVVITYMSSRSWSNIVRSVCACGLRKRMIERR